MWLKGAILLGNALPFLCPVKGCIHFKKPIYADTSQIRIHLMRDHDYKQYQESSYENKLIPSKIFRSRIFFVKLLCDYGIVKGATAWPCNIIVFPIIIVDARVRKAVIVGVIKKEVLKMKRVEMLLDYCPLCKTELLDTYRVTRLIHDIMNHREYFESMCASSTRGQVLETLYVIIEHYYRDEKIWWKKNQKKNEFLQSPLELIELVVEAVADGNRR